MLQVTELDICRDFPAPEFPVEAIPQEEWRNGLIVRMPFRAAADVAITADVMKALRPASVTALLS